MMKKDIKIAILMTCHNRKEKTLQCVSTLCDALARYHVSASDGNIDAKLFLTDDGCTDGTAEAVGRECHTRNLQRTIVKGDGNLYWAGGMRLAWMMALKDEQSWNYYLLLNDDTLLQPDAFSMLFNAQRYCLDTYGCEGIVSGITSAIGDSSTMTYGGEVFVNKFTCRRRLLTPIGKPQLCDWAHANILFVPHQVVETQGILYKDYVHGQADLDYSYKARQRGIPVVVTAQICGTCNFDHPDVAAISKLLCAMTFSERRNYLKHPLHSDADYLLMTRRCMPQKYPLTWLFRKIHLYLPHFYYWLHKKR